MQTWPVAGDIVDCCAPQGSALVAQLRDDGFDARGEAAPGQVGQCDWIVTNPPYARPLVDQIAGEVLALIKAGTCRVGAAMLMRANWDLAQRRTDLFADPLYRGQTRLRFRPWWTAERRCQPIHSYAWLVWSRGAGPPVIRYWPLPAIVAGTPRSMSDQG